MKNKIIILNMDEHNIEKLALLEKEYFSDPWSKNTLRDEITNENSQFLIAEKDNRICGYIGMYWVLDEGYLTNVATSKEQRRMGIATVLLEDIFNRCIDLNLSFLSLEVRVSNMCAISLYKKLGFKNIGIRKKFYNHPIEDALIMTKYFKTP